MADDRQKLTALLQGAFINPGTFAIETEGRPQWQLFQKVAGIEVASDAVTIRCQDQSVLRYPISLELTRGSDGALKCVTRNMRGVEQRVSI